MFNISKTAKIFTLTTIIILLLIGAYSAFFFFLTEKSKNLSVLLNEIDSSVGSETELRNLRKMSNQVKLKSSELDEYFLSKDKLVDFLEDLEDLENNTGALIEVKSIVEKENGVFTNLVLDISASGSWEAVYHFFILLENIPYDVEIDKVQFNRSSRGSDDEKGNWRGGFTINVTQIKT